MRKRLIWAAVLLILIIGIALGAWFGYKHTRSDQTTQPAKPSLPTKKVSTPAKEKPHQLYGNRDTILINQSLFAPRALITKPNSTVQWTNMETTTHQIVTDDGTTITAAKSPVLAQGQSFEFIFTKAGTYKYHDNLHPKMQATVTVE